MWRHLAAYAAAFALPIAGIGGQAARAQTPWTPSAPVAHENLAIYFVRGTSAGGPVPLTLQEGLAKGLVTVHETGTVSRLEIENASDEEVFIQAGDIVKGGQQDRVLTVSLLLAPKSGRLPIDAYCVEQGRWSARGKEDVKRFLSAEKALPSREAKMAMLGAIARQETASAARAAGDGGRRTLSSNIETTAPAAQGRGTVGIEDRERILGQVQAERQRRESAGGDIGQQQAQRRTGGASAQGEVWNGVASMQRKLSENLQAAVASPQSASSLQLSLENQRLAEAKAAYVAKLKDAGEKDTDIVGFIVAINGRLTSAELYPSNGLFRKMWSKQLEASATEAIGEKGGKTETLPPVEAALAFLSEAEKAKPTAAKIDARLDREAREADASFYVETKRRDGALVHRSYLAK